MGQASRKAACRADRRRSLRPRRQDIQAVSGTRVSVAIEVDREVVKESVGVGMPRHYRTPDLVACVRGEAHPPPRATCFNSAVQRRRVRRRGDHRQPDPGGGRRGSAPRRSTARRPTLRHRREPPRPPRRRRVVQRHLPTPADTSIGPISTGPSHSLPNRLISSGSQSIRANRTPPRPLTSKGNL